MDILRQTAYMVLSPMIVDNFASLFNCMAVGSAPRQMTAPKSVSDGRRLTISVCGHL